MSKKMLMIAAIAATMLFACKDKPNQHDGGDGGNGGGADTSLAASQSVSVEQANNMIKSYLNSINYEKNDTDLHCLIVNADSLRAYLNDTSKGKITKVKLMLAHTPVYIKKCEGNPVNCGYKAGALTLIIAGYDSKNNYVYDKNGRVMDHLAPCPESCPKAGEASNDFIVKRK